MNREAFENRLQDLLDARRSPASDVELVRAADEQPELRALLTAYELLASAPRSVPALRGDLTERVLSEWKQLPTPLRPAMPSWLAPLAAVAATLVIATSIAFLAQDRGANQLVDKPSENSATVAQSPIADAPDLNRLTRQAALNYRSLAANTEASFSSALSVVQPNRRKAATTEPATPEDSNWLRSVPNNLRPLSNSASGAVYSLMRAVPGTDSDKQEGY
ncbi:MAG: hypothetical protein SGJ19_25510 [Planctomycetia bacterium]|mgnify:CR=1 FL=1|nr:hypothetical protein [Planctomycetia bacterium]